MGILQQGVGDASPGNRVGIWRDGTLLYRAGQRAPGANPVQLLDNFASSSVMLNDQGTVAYLATLREGVAGVDSSNDRGLWRDDTLLARTGGMPVPGVDGATFRFLMAPSLNNGGQVAVVGSLTLGPADVT